LDIKAWNCSLHKPPNPLTLFMFWVEELKFFLDEKCMDFLLLAENPEGEARAYAFKFRGEIIYT